MEYAEQKRPVEPVMIRLPETIKNDLHILKLT